MLEKYGSVVGRIGFILVVIGLFLIIRGFLKLHGALARVLDSTSSTYLGIGSLIVGVILIGIFVYTFVVSERRHK